MDELTYITDRQRHLVCTPYSKDNLHRMAEALGIKRCWFHSDHYDIPKRRIAEIEALCQIGRAEGNRLYHRQETKKMKLTKTDGNVVYVNPKQISHFEVDSNPGSGSYVRVWTHGIWFCVVADDMKTLVNAHDMSVLW